MKENINHLDGSAPSSVQVDCRDRQAFHRRIRAAARGCSPTGEPSQWRGTDIPSLDKLGIFTAPWRKAPDGASAGNQTRSILKAGAVNGGAA